MAKSPFFARIKSDVVRIMQAVPHGRLVTFFDIGRHLDVAPRHAAYILARLDPDERSVVPWHRAVAEDGRASDAKGGAEGSTQRDLLVGDGLTIVADGRILDFEARLIAVAALDSGVPAQIRPPDAPVARRSSRLQRSRA